MFTQRRLNLCNSMACAAFLLASCCPAAFADPTFATWTAASGSTASGTLDGVSFTVTNLTNPTLSNENLSGTDFSANPGSASQASLIYAGESNFTVAFASSIAVLYVYEDFWHPYNLAHYDFSQPITILSGNSDTTLVGGTNLDATNADN
jgi:hypothetical protein